MKNAMKKLLSLALALVLVVGVFPMATLAAENDRKAPQGFENQGNWQKPEGPSIDKVEKPEGPEFNKGEKPEGPEFNKDEKPVKPEMPGDKEEAATTLIVVFKVDGKEVQQKEVTPSNGKYALVEDLITYHCEAIKTQTLYYKQAYNMTTKEYVSLGTSINVGEEVHIALSTKAEDQNEQVGSEKYIHLLVKIDGTAVYENDKLPKNEEYATVKDLLTYVYDEKWEEKYELGRAYDMTTGKDVALNDGVKAGHELHINLLPKNVKPEQNNKPGQDNKPGDEHKPGDKFEKGDVLLKIYVNGNTKSAAKVVDMASYAKDNKITLTEAEKVVRKYYEEKDSDDDMDVDGLFTAESWNHGKYNMRQAKKSVEVSENGDTIIYVMVRDAQKISSSTSTADTSNPKTGDNIMMVVSVMVLSGAALAYVFSKKRAAK